ncbi:MAG: hypothetical protein LBN02_04530 [Oscillospiraceae bacterium]|jgi:hypothetical protein|nr:hypothetical protein [Oscillospiraceae bacterium]
MDEKTQKLMENDCKVYVDVTEDRTKDGQILPRSFVWEDGRRYEIDRVVEVRRAASLRAGGIGMRYKVMIQGRERFMWLEDSNGGGKWFVERIGG